jgi:hypothetical protein
LCTFQPALWEVLPCQEATNFLRPCCRAVLHWLPGLALASSPWSHEPSWPPPYPSTPIFAMYHLVCALVHNMFFISCRPKARSWCRGAPSRCVAHAPCIYTRAHTVLLPCCFAMCALLGWRLYATTGPHSASAHTSTCDIGSSWHGPRQPPPAFQ